MGEWEPRGRDYVLARAGRHLEAHIAEAALGDTSAWPHSIGLGRPTAAQIRESVSEIARSYADLAALDEGHGGPEGVRLVTAGRIAGGRQTVPLRVVVETPLAEASLAGPDAVRELRDASSRAETLASACPYAARGALLRVVRRTAGMTDTDLAALASAADILHGHMEGGLTTREIPLAGGADGKWLDRQGRMELAMLLAGREDNGVAETGWNFLARYIDPGYCSGPARRYDTFFDEDAHARPAYRPEAVVIVENKDTFMRLRPIVGGICVFGSGRAGAARIAARDWVRDCPRCLYWGDIDQDGLEILDRYRECGLDCRSVLMDAAAYREYEWLATDLMPDGRPIKAHRAQAVANLTAQEREAYEAVGAKRGPHGGAMRIEQELISLDVAAERISDALGLRGTTSA